MLIEETLTDIARRVARIQRAVEKNEGIEPHASEKESSTDWEYLRSYTGWSLRTAQDRARYGEVPCRKIGRGVYEFRAKEILAWNALGRPPVKEFYATYQPSNT